MASASALISITAYARSGALDRAWQIFRDAGFDKVTDDAAVLSVRGRLLKDQALRVSGQERRRCYLRAADAYAQAARIGNSNYPLINAATLCLLARQPQKSRALARKVLECGPDTLDTPYWQQATRAEALLLIGDTAEAKDALTAAMRQAPRAFEDHASTLRQFRLILQAAHEDAGWLDQFQPPRAMHFAGAMSLLREEEKTLPAKIAAVIAKENVGAGFGALAAGADILIAEALLASNAELHLVLPSPPATFRDTSVARYGQRWSGRFDAVIKASASIRVLQREPDAPLPLAVRLAAEIAMGHAVMQAESLQSEAIQLVLLPQERGAKIAGSSASIAASWRKSGRRAYVLRSKGGNRGTPRVGYDRHRNLLAAMLRIEFSGNSATVAKVLKKLRARLQSARAALTLRWLGDALLIECSTPAAGAKAALVAVRDHELSQQLKIAAHYGIAERQSDPFGGRPYLTGSVPDLLRAIIALTPAGVFHASEDFVAGLYEGPKNGRPHAEFVGDFPTATESGDFHLFAIRP